MNKTRKNKHKIFKLTTLGFTLIELLTVMVVLGVILTIITPFVFKTIEKVKMNVWANSAYAMMNAVRKEKYVSIKELDVNANLVFVYENGIESSNIQGMKLEYVGTPPKSGKVIMNNEGDIAIAIYNGVYCAKKEYNEINVIVYVEDEPSECTIIEDLMPPQITILGENPTYIDASSSYVDTGAEAIDDVDGDITHKLIKTGNVNVNVPGSYTITYRATDSSGNAATATRIVIVKDNIPPIVSYSPNGNDTYKKTQSTRVTVIDQHGTVSSREYQWTTTSIFPTSGTWTSFNNGSIITQANGTGDYYLHIKAIDDSNNEANITSNVFKLDNTNPSVSGVTIDASNIEATSFTITRNGDAIDAHSDLAINPYKYQISTDDSNWTTKCTNNTTTCNAIGLNADTTYYYRVCVVDKAGNETCINSKNVRTKFLCPGTVITDSRDGEKYCTVQIGDQVWFAENLRYIGNGCTGKTWNSSTTNACRTHTKSDCSGTGLDYYCTFSETEVLYQWGATSCPSGWHIPTDEEWMVLEEYVETSSGVNWNTASWRGTDAGKNLKSSSDWNGTDSVGFNALPVGYRIIDGGLYSVGIYGSWWSSSVLGSDAWSRRLNSSNDTINRNRDSQSSGFVARCLWGLIP